MSENDKSVPAKQTIFQQYCFKIKIFAVVILLFAFGWILSSAFVVHHTELPDHYWTHVSVLKSSLLDAPGFLSFLTIVIMINIVIVLWLFWRLHSLPEKHSEHTGQTRLVFWLCMLGIFFNWLWVAAVLIVVTDWTKIADGISGGRSVMKKDPLDQDVEEYKS